jgi:hypothetical protein
MPVVASPISKEEVNANDAAFSQLGRATSEQRTGHRAKLAARRIATAASGAEWQSLLSILADRATDRIVSKETRTAPEKPTRDAGECSRDAQLGSEIWTTTHWKLASTGL